MCLATPYREPFVICLPLCPSPLCLPHTHPLSVCLSLNGWTEMLHATILLPQFNGKRPGSVLRLVLPVQGKITETQESVCLINHSFSS
jgi:hypothetical protein